MRRLMFVVAAAALVGGCAPSRPLVNAVELYRVEENSRQLTPRPDVGVFYVIPTKESSVAVRLLLEIDGQKSAMTMGDHSFYVFCLSRGSHDVRYIGNGLSKDKMEFLHIEPGKIYVRGVNYDFTSLIVNDLATDRVAEVLASRQIGTDYLYLGSTSICRSPAHSG